MKSRLPTFDHENALKQSGYQRIAGIDEAGRGALAGPVVAAAVILDPDRNIDGVRDSKLIPEAEREHLYDVVTSGALLWSVGIVDNNEIDRINILQATFAAMHQAVSGLALLPDIALIDGRDTPAVGVPCRALIGGDAICTSIAAASIIAKVTRDRIMREYHGHFPKYGFDRHKGYATVVHRKAILQFGPASIHRRSFLGKLLQEQMSF